MEKLLTTGQMIDQLLENPQLEFIDSTNEWNALIIRECVVMRKFVGHSSSTITLDDKNKIWKIKK